MGGTVALKSVNKNVSGKLQFCSYIYVYMDHPFYNNKSFAHLKQRDLLYNTD